MSERAPREDPIGRAVGVLLASVARSTTMAQADLAIVVIRAQLVEQIDAKRDPDAAAILRLVLGRLHDATETGGTRR